MSSDNKNDYYKISRPFSIYKVTAMEDYFRFMSKQGKHIVSLSEGFFDDFGFKEGVPLDRDYKLLMTKEKSLKDELKQELSDLGWEYVCSEQPTFRKQRFHLFKAKDENVDFDIIDSKNKKVVSEFQHGSILSVLTSSMTITGLCAFMIIFLIIGIDFDSGMDLGINHYEAGAATALLVIFTISDIIRHYFEIGYEKEYLQEVISKHSAKQEWEVQEQRYKRKEKIINIFTVVAMVIPFLILVNYIFLY